MPVESDRFAIRFGLSATSRKCWREKKQKEAETHRWE